MVPVGVFLNNRGKKKRWEVVKSVSKDPITNLEQGLSDGSFQS